MANLLLVVPAGALALSPTVTNCGGAAITAPNNLSAYSCWAPPPGTGKCICDTLLETKAHNTFTPPAGVAIVHVKAWSAGAWTAPECVTAYPGNIVALGSGGGTAYGDVVLRFGAARQSIDFELGHNLYMGAHAPARSTSLTESVGHAYVLDVGAGGQGGCDTVAPGKGGAGGALVGQAGTDVVRGSCTVHGGGGGTQSAGGAGGYFTGQCSSVVPGVAGPGPHDSVAAFPGLPDGGGGFYSGGTGAYLNIVSPPYSGAGGGSTSLPTGPDTGWATGGQYEQPGQVDDPDRTLSFPGSTAGAGVGEIPGARGATNGRIVFEWDVPAKGDLNGDTQTDLIVRENTTWQHDVWIMNGAVRVVPPLTISPTPDTSLELSGVDDFTGDQRGDLVFATTSGAVEFWPMDGAVRVAPPIALTGLASPWKLSATADFNHDGKADLVWRNFATQKIVIWTMNGTTQIGTLVPTPDQAVDSNWEIVAALDFGNDAQQPPCTPSCTAVPAGKDGNTDLLWYNAVSGKIVLWFMDSSVVRYSGKFTTPANAGDNNWKVLAAGDFGLGPDDPLVPQPPVAGSNDIVWRNATSGRFVVWHMDFTGVRTGGEFTTPMEPSPNPTNWTIVGPR